MSRARLLPGVIALTGTLAAFAPRAGAGELSGTLVVFPAPLEARFRDDYGVDEEGVLEVKAAQLGEASAWIRTTDLARIDGDGFLWILGRADRVIIRGGFKVRPDDVRAALERHPRVRGAAVVSRPDARLGAVPVAAVELRRGGGAVTVDDLLAHASATLARYELPAEIRIVDELPRTASAKVDLAAVAALFPGA